MQNLIDYTIKISYTTLLMDTNKLIKKCIDNDMKAWDRFISIYTPLVTKSVHYKLKKFGRNMPREEKKDIVQEIFLDIWEKKKLSMLNKTSSLKGWLVITSLNYTSNYCMKKSFHKIYGTYSLESPVSEKKPEIKLKDVICDKKNDIEALLAENDIKALIEKNISYLNPKYQLAFKLNIYAGLKHKEIADVMHVPIGTVGTMISRAKEHIKTSLRKVLMPGRDK